MKKEAFGELVISNQESWYRIAKSYLCNDADCADAIQNAIVHAFENLYSLRNDKYAKTWFIRILINECHQVIRENKKVVTWEEYQEEGREAEYIRGYGQYSELYESIMRLKENERACIILYYFEEYSIREIAQCLESTRIGSQETSGAGKGAFARNIKGKIGMKVRTPG